MTAVELLPVHRLKIKALFHKQHDLTTWDRKFILRAHGSSTLNEDQIRELEDIYEVFRWSEQIDWKEVVETWKEN